MAREMGGYFVAEERLKREKRICLLICEEAHVERNRGSRKPVSGRRKYSLEG